MKKQIPFFELIFGIIFYGFLFIMFVIGSHREWPQEKNENQITKKIIIVENSYLYEIELTSTEIFLNSKKIEKFLPQRYGGITYEN